MTERPPVQLQLDLKPEQPIYEYSLKGVQPHYEYSTLKGADCIGGRALRVTSDQYKCRTCGVVWGIDEPRPPCDNGTSTKG